MTKKLFNGTICRVIIQCTNPATGATGSFLSTAYEGENTTLECVASPHFYGLCELFLWMHDKGFKPVTNSIDTAYLSPKIEVSIN